jgi:hypothetical protein
MRRCDSCSKTYSGVGVDCPSCGARLSPLLTQKSLEQTLAETVVWAELRDRLTDQLKMDSSLTENEFILLDEFLRTNWPDGGVPRQTEVSALEQRVRWLEHRSETKEKT